MEPVPPFSAITAGSLLHLAWALLWAVLVFSAVCGYGLACVRATGYRRPAFVLAATAGFGVSIFLGGLLNLFHLITIPILIGFVGVGVLLAVPRLLSRGTQPAESPAVTAPMPSSAGKALMAAFVLACAFRLVASVHTPYYQIQDDLNFYLAAPVKMLETHSFAPDPYSERRIISSVGGNQFLNTLVLATQPLENVQMADRTLGLLLLALLTFALAAEFELTSFQRAVFALLVFITPQLQFNLTFVILPSTLFFGLVYVAANRRLTQSYAIQQAVILGAVVAAIASMKSTYVVHGVVFVLSIGLLRCWKQSLATGIRLVLVAAVSCFLVLLPWMIASHADSGTWFYPMLGKGFHYSAYKQFPPPSSFLLSTLIRKVAPFSLPLIVLGIAEWVWGERDEPSLGAFALTLAALAATVLVGVATGGDSVRRYNYPCILPAILLLYPVFARRGNLSPNPIQARRLEAGAALLVVATAVYVGLNSFTKEYLWMARSFKTSLTDYRITSAATREEYAAVQAALPPDGNVMATVNDPFLFDFSKRNIFLADFAGAGSPKPGWPAHQDGEALARFLLQYDVHYLVYAYGDCGLSPPYPDCSTQRSRESLKQGNDPNISQLIRNESLIQFDAFNQYNQLALSRRHVYDDGKIYILDLKGAK